MTKLGPFPPRLLAARDLGRERLELVIPEPPERIEPFLDLLERAGVERIEPAARLSADLGEAAVAQHAQVLRDGGLADPELRGDHLDHRARGLLPRGEQLQDPSSHRITEDV